MLGQQVDLEAGNLSLEIGNVSGFVDALLAALVGEFSNTNGSLFVDLSKGTIRVDAAGLLGDLNNLPPNSEFFSEEFADRVIDSVTDIATSIAGAAVDSLLGALRELSVSIAGDITASTLGLSQTGTVTIAGTAEQVLGLTDPPTIDLSVIVNVPIAGPVDIGARATPLVAPAIHAMIAERTGPLIDEAMNSINDSISTHLASALAPHIDPFKASLRNIFDGGLSLVVNQQSAQDTAGVSGALGEGAASVTALALAMPGDTNIQIATSTVRCAGDGLSPEALADGDSRGALARFLPVALLAAGAAAIAVIAAIAIRRTKR